MLNLEEYNAVFSCDLSKEAFDVIMGSPVKIQDADELIFVNAETHEKIVFKRMTEVRDPLRYQTPESRLPTMETREE